MSIMGISRSDLNNSGWNLAVGAGVASGCALVAYLVKRTGVAILNPKALKKNSHLTHRCELAGAAVGTLAAFYMNSHISASRYALINDPSLGKMLKLGLVQAVAGLFLDCIMDLTKTVLTIFGAGGAVAGYSSRYALIGFGALGALIGSNSISITLPSKRTNF